MRARFTSPESYTPKHLAERILRSKAALEDERKQVTVLFADLKGSMELLAERDPEEARKILDPVLERMMEAVHRYEGTVNQVMGDGIMALFGAPVAHEDHAVRACYAALRMQESVQRHAEGVFRSFGVPIQIRVGLNSGEVVVRAIGSDLHMDYTAVGQTTHLAARMEQMATPGTILLAAATLRYAEGFIHVAVRGPVAVKGLPEPVEVYELTGATALPSRLHAAAARGLTQFVGRDSEIEQLSRALALAHHGRGQLVAVVGEPGVGKSRLVYEFRHSTRTEEWLTLEARSASYGKATSYLPVIDLLKTYFKVHDRDSHRDIREKVIGRLLTLDGTLEPSLPALLALLDVPVEDAQWEASDPAQRRQRTQDALKHLLLQESQKQPLLVIFEDLQWIDNETQALLDGLVEILPTARLLLLVNSRPEYRHPWSGKTYYRQVRIDTLRPENADEFLDALLGVDSFLGPLKQLLVERTEANPLFLEESVRALVETAALVGERGAYRLTRPVEHLTIPATVQAILAARIDRLTPEAKRLLQAAAVVGKDVPFGLLRAIADLSDDDLRRYLSHLQTGEFLYEAGLFPDPEYTFKHALTHDVALGSLLHDDLRALHVQIVDAIERLYAGRIIQHVEQLARHALGGELWDKAVRYSRDAASKAMSRSASREAVTWFERAVQALSHLPESEDRGKQAIDLHLYAASPLFALGKVDSILQHLREVEGLAEAAADARALGRTYSYMSECLWLMAQPARGLEYARRGLDIAAVRDNVPIQAGLHFVMGHAHHALGQYRLAASEFEWHVSSLTGDLLYRRLGFTGLPSVLARAWLASALAELGEFAEALVRTQEAVQISEAAAHPFSLVGAYWSLGSVHLRRGERDLAIAALERAVQAAERWEIPLWLIWIAPALGASYVEANAVERALPLLETALEQVKAMGVMTYYSLLVARLAEACLVSGRLSEAANRAQQALEWTRERGERGTEADTLRLLGDIGLRADPVDAAGTLDSYSEAMAVAEELSMRPLIAHCHAGLAKLYRRTSKREKAQEHLTTARTMYREMGMTYWLEQVEAETLESS